MKNFQIKLCYILLLLGSMQAQVLADTTKYYSDKSKLNKVKKYGNYKNYSLNESANKFKESQVITKKNIESNAIATVFDANKVVLNFENTDIQTTIKAISQLSGKNFVIDPRVKGTVTIVSDQPIAKSDSYKVLETALRMQGFAVVEGDGVIKVLPETDAKTYGMDTALEGTHNKHLGDQIITKIFIIQRGSATQLANSLRPLVAQNNSISAYPNSNALIVTDYASNVNRISKIINQISATVENRVKPIVVTLKYAVASDVAQMLQSYLQTNNSGGSSGGGGDTPTTSITVEPTTNSIIIYSTVKSQMYELETLALKLDKNIGGVNNSLHVVYLKNADAAHIADVLRVVASGQENPDMTASSSRTKFAAEPASIFQSANGGGGSFGGSGAAPSKPVSQATRSANSQAKDAPKIFIQAEPSTNALIIQAPDAVYKNLRMIIEMLDVRRAQVLIEAMIAEINTSVSGTFGIQWVAGAGNNQVGGIGIGNYAGNGASLNNVGADAVGIVNAVKGGATAAATPPSLPNEVLIGLVTGTVSVGGQTIPAIGALADMIASNSNVNILSRPTLITLDNEEARILVGQNIGLPNGQYVNTASQSTLATTVTRQDIGTFLNIKPMITQSGSIQLDLYQEDSQIDSTSTASSVQNGPAINTRRIRSTMLVDDGQIIAIGGMIKDNISIQKSGIPGLSNIPYLGWLFSWQSRTHVKTNLVLFLRPVIIRNTAGYATLTNKRYQYILEQQNAVKAQGNLLLPEIDPITVENQVPKGMNDIPVQNDDSVKDLPIIDLRKDSINHNLQNKHSQNQLHKKEKLLVQNNSVPIITPKRGGNGNY